jgi:hypothetical protein
VAGGGEEEGVGRYEIELSVGSIHESLLTSLGLLILDVAMETGESEPCRDVHGPHSTRLRVMQTMDVLGIGTEEC